MAAILRQFLPRTFEKNLLLQGQDPPEGSYDKLPPQTALQNSSDECTK